MVTTKPLYAVMNIYSLVICMPGGDGTGPCGRGPMTGWGMGPCGRGRGMRRYGMGYGARGRGRCAFPPAQPKPEDEKAYLQELEKELGEELKQIQKRLEELK